MAPKGTLYGRNTTGGAYNIQHKLPTNTLDMGASAEYAAYDSGGHTSRYQAFISGPILGDVVTARLAVGTEKADAFSRNLYTGRRAPQKSNQAIATVQIKPSSDVTLTLRGDTYDQDGRVGANFHVITPGTLNASADIPANPYQYRADFPGDDNYLRNHGWSANLEWNLPNRYKFRAISGGRNVSINTEYDSDGTELPVYTAVLDDQSKSLSHELQLLSPTGGQVEWITGLHYYRERAHDLTTSGGPYQYRGPWYLLDGSNQYLFSSATNRYLSFASLPFEYRGRYDSRNETNSYAAFGQLRLNVTDKLKLTFGLRYTDEKRTFSGDAGTTLIGQGPAGIYGFDPVSACRALIAANPVSSPAGLTADAAQTVCQTNLTRYFSTYGATKIQNRADKSFRVNNTSGRFVLDYYLDRDTHSYFSVTQGFKSGGFNSYDTNAAYSDSKPGQPGVPTIAFQPPFGPEKLTSYELGLKANAFDKRLQYNLNYWYYNWKNIQSQVYNYTTATSTVTNDARATAQGPEVELKARPWDDASIDFNGAYIKSRYTHFASTISDVVTGANDVDFTGSPLTNTAKWKWNLGFQQTMSLGRLGDLTPRVEYQHRSSGYSVFTRDTNAIAGGYNLFNLRLTYRAYSPHIEASLYAENLTNRQYDYYRFGSSTTGVVGITAPPRTIGLQLRAYH